MKKKSIDKNAANAVDKTVVFDRSQLSNEVDIADLLESLGIKSYSDREFYKELNPLGEGGVGLVVFRDTPRTNDTL